MEPLPLARIMAELETLDNWTYDENKLSKTFSFDDFAQALDFVNEVGRLAEDQGHHPDIHLSYGSVHIELTTHDAGGVTERDFALARAIPQGT